MRSQNSFRTEWAKYWVHIPSVLTILFVLAMLSDSLRPHILPWMRENGPVELATFGLALIAGCLGFGAARRQAKLSGFHFNAFFLCLFASGILVVAMEEIAWGQSFLNYSTPDYFVQNNAQQEITLHNLYGMHGASDYLYLIFGLAGMFGLWGFRGEAWKGIAVRPYMLSILLAISLGSTFSVAQGLWQFGSVESGLGRKLAERCWSCG